MVALGLLSLCLRLVAPLRVRRLRPAPLPARLDLVRDAMRVCVPSAGPGGLDDWVGEHFGRVPTYTIYDTETGQVEILPNTSEHMGGVGLPAELLAQAGVEVVICAGLGRRAIGLLSQSGIEVCTGATGTVREAIEAWRSGKLSGADACDRHLFHDRHG